MTEQGRGPSTMSNLDELERLLEAATPGPWTITRYEQGGGRIFRDNTLIADLFQEADREYIAAVLTEVPALIAAARRAEALSDVNRLASIIREVDGDHSLGAGALAEAIVARATLTGEGAPR